jgi:transcriptional regulator with XRE-family HTH domain
VNTRDKPGGLESGASLGLRVARARQEAGLSEKELARRLGLSLWRIERLQRGDEDARSHLLEIAEATGKPAEWFLGDRELERGTDGNGATATQTAPPETPRPGTRPKSLPPRGRSSSLRRLRAAGKELSSRWSRLARARLSDEEDGDRSGVPAETEAASAADAQRPAEPAASAKALAGRVARARQEAGLSQKELAAVLDASLWRVEQIESGGEDPGGYLPKIAAQTGKDEQWFTEAATAPQETVDEAEDGEVGVASGKPGDAVRAAATLPARSPLPRSFRRDVVFAAIALLVVSRFFTEVIHILPRATKLVDIPVLVLLAALALTLPTSRVEEEKGGFPYFALGALFLVIALFSALANLGRLAPGPTLVFLYGFLAPIGVYYAVYRLWPPGSARSLSRLLVGLAALQFVVVAFIDLPRFLSTRNPDVMTGTFGENGYQLVFFLLVTAAMVAGVYTFERRRLTARLAPFFFLATLITIILVQYRALLLTIALTVLLIATLLGFIRLRGAVAAVLIAVTFGLSLSYLSAQFPVLKYSETVGTLVNDPGLYISKRASVVVPVAKLFNDDPLFSVTGTGPGTFSSRAWYVYQPASRTQKALGVNPGGSQGYQTDVATKYVTPRLRADKTAQSVGGSYSVTSPLSSYTSLLAEVGIFGFLAIMSIYYGALFYALRMTIRSLRRPSRGDPLPGLLLGCTAGFFVLLQMGILDNWLEVTRLTFILWALMAVATKEFSVRYGPNSPASERQLLASGARRGPRL